MDDPRETGNFAPEAHNQEQDDEDAQAQTVADEVLARRGDFALSDSEKVGGSDLLGANTPDLVDHMNQMATSGRIDMSAFRGERSDDDEEGFYGEDAIEDDSPRGAE
jgi:hypothetical protein